MKNKLWFIQLFIIGLSVFLSNSYKKNETKNDPIITCTTPADNSFRTLLSYTYPNSSANIFGLLLYKPTIGKVASLGASQNLKEDFTHIDAGNYNSNRKTVKKDERKRVSSAVFSPRLSNDTMIDIDGNVYKTIVIGMQTWMAENLRVTRYRNGDPIPNVTNNTAWAALLTGAYCNYANTTDKDQIVTNGALYNWYAVTDSRNIAPSGWHVPTDAEWTTLITFLGGEGLAGAKMKESGTAHWNSPNNSATNESGFNATPMGYRRYDDGEFEELGDNASYWCITQSSTSGAWYRYLYSYGANCHRYEYSKVGGFAVRLMKD